MSTQRVSYSVPRQLYRSISAGMIAWLKAKGVKPSSPSNLDARLKGIGKIQPIPGPRASRIFSSFLSLLLLLTPMAQAKLNSFHHLNHILDHKEKNPFDIPFLEPKPQIVPNDALKHHKGNNGQVMLSLAAGTVGGFIAGVPRWSTTLTIRESKWTIPLWPGALITANQLPEGPANGPVIPGVDPIKEGSSVLLSRIMLAVMGGAGAVIIDQQAGGGNKGLLLGIGASAVFNGILGTLVNLTGPLNQIGTWTQSLSAGARFALFGAAVGLAGIAANRGLRELF